MTLESRRLMINEQLEARGIRDPRLLDAFLRVPREEFVPEEYRDRAFEDRPLAIGCDQTISQPWMVACMTEALQLKGGERVLEIGTGSGYQTAILAEMDSKVWTIERFPELSADAQQRLRQYPDLHFRVGDGTVGWPEEAPFDRILVTAGAPEVPLSLLQQLTEGGRMVIPVGPEARQELQLITRQKGAFLKSRICDCIFVKLVGKEGW